MSVILNRRMKWRRWEGQSNVSLIIDCVDALCFRVSAMPIGTRVEMAFSGVIRNLHDEVRILILAGSGRQDNFFVDLLRPTLGSIEAQAVYYELVLRAIVKL